MDTITQAVGIRYGKTMMPNNQNDLRTITNLLDRIPAANGGTAAAPRLWSSDRTLLITQVTAAVTLFQTINRRPTIDGVADPGGGTIGAMNRLAAPGPISATVVNQDVNSQLWVVAEPSSMNGRGSLLTRDISPSLTRKLVSVSGSSIKWFGVVLPLNQSGGVAGGAPHIFFTPSPWQGNFFDGGYDQFTSWNGLWDKYTSIIGSQLVASGASHILVIPFYKNSQTGNLGNFLNNWREVISSVITAAINATDPLFLRDTYQFTEIFSSSFSNGITSHQNFNTRGINAESMTRLTFDLDGQAAGSNWRPNNGIIYLNTPAPHGTNPVGTHFHVGGRFANLHPRYPGTSDHNLCPFLLYHGLSSFGR